MGVWELLRFLVTGAPLARPVHLSEDFNAFPSGSVVDIVVPHDDLLVRDVTLPKLPARELAHAVELDAIRATPFQKETITVGQSVYARTNDNVSVRQFVARHSDIERWCEKARAAKLSVRAVFPADAPAAKLADFTDTLMEETALWRKLNVSLVVVIALLAAIAAWRPVVGLQTEQAQTEARVTELRTEAARLQSQIDGIEDRSLGLRVVADRQADAAQTLARIDALTKVLPDNAWVVHLVLDHETMRLTGNVTGDPLSLLDRLAATPGFGPPLLTASFALNDGTGGQRFEIEMPFATGGQP